MSRLEWKVAANWLHERRLDQAHEFRGLIEVDRMARRRYDGKVRLGHERVHAGANLSVARVKLADDQLHRLLDFWQARPQGGLLAGAHAAQAHR